MHGVEHDSPAPLQPAAWRDSVEYLYGVDLFNHGYYWEAHEAWESLWHAAGRTGVVANFLKGLIKLAAAGVKSREGNAQGVRRHTERGIELLITVVQGSSLQRPDYCGIQLDGLVLSAQSQLNETAEFEIAIHLH